MLGANGLFLRCATASEMSQGSILLPYRAYMQLPLWMGPNDDNGGGYTGSGWYARESYELVFDDDNYTTGISNVNPTTNVSRTGWYTLSGLRLQGVPVKKGMYIHDGKKVMVK